MNKLAQYSNYVLKQLNQVPKTEYKLAAYDNGCGLTIAEEQGPQISAMDTVASRLVHISEPYVMVKADSDEWDECWQAAKNIVNGFLEARNKEIK